MNKRWIMIWDVPEVTAWYKGKQVILCEAPKNPFNSICIATDQEIGLFVMKCLPLTK